jgi:hypothetical protein
MAYSFLQKTVANTRFIFSTTLMITDFSQQFIEAVVLCSMLDKTALVSVAKTRVSDAFAHFAQEKHCFEPLLFIHEAEAYRKSYGELQKAGVGTTYPSEAARVAQEWNGLMRAFIEPGSPDELNIPAKIRAAILGLACYPNLTPAPDELNPVIGHAYEILSDNVLVAFVSSCSSAMELYTQETSSTEEVDKFVTMPPLTKTPQLHSPARGGEPSPCHVS